MYGLKLATRQQGCIGSGLPLRMEFNSMPLRTVCSKIIHATKVEPHATKGSAFHLIDEDNVVGWSEAVEQAPDKARAEPDRIAWEHLSGNIRLSGTQNNKDKTPWSLLLDVPTLVKAVFELLDHGAIPQTGDSAE